MQSRTELRELASHLARVREEEREAIAREIHDDVGSTLMAVKFDVAWLKGQLRHEAPTTAKLVELDRLVDVAILSSSRIMHDLRPGILDEGIVAALEWQARDFQQRMGIACGFAASAEEIPVDRATAIAAFRICQEALSNVAKYAAARRVDVRLDGAARRAANDDPRQRQGHPPGRSRQARLLRAARHEGARGLARGQRGRHRRSGPGHDDHLDAADRRSGRR